MTRFPYVRIPGALRPMPRIPFTLRRGNQAVDVYGLVDSGASVNFIPYSVGIALGARWEDQRRLEPIGGALGHAETRGVFITFDQLSLTGNTPVQLAFAWASRSDLPVILGQEDFLLKFDVCFYGAEDELEITRR